MPGAVCVSQDIDQLRRELATATTVALDTETTGVDYHHDRIIGVAFYVEGSDTGYYLPVYSSIDHPREMVGLETVGELVALVLGDPARRVVMHNAQFDLLMLRGFRRFREEGLAARCRVFDTMLGTHRLDNTYWDSSWQGQTLDYRLKTLSQYLLGETQQTFDSVTGGLPAEMVPASEMAAYAVDDVYFTMRLYQHLRGKLLGEPGVDRVLEDLDFPTQPLLVEMLYGGVPIDRDTTDRHAQSARGRFAQVTNELQVMLGRPANPLQGKVLRRALLQDCGIQAVRRWRSLSEDALEPIQSKRSGRRCVLFPPPLAGEG